ncbi:MAG: M18 family aminopeptidase [Desulfobacteraceae bacterium]|nr:M18 family aminopeptidase [Desulfobacteraceae bacterium]
MTPKKFNQDLFSFIDQSPSPFHAVRHMEDQLKATGFSRLEEKDAWNLEAGGKYYVTRNRSSVIAFIMGKSKPWESGIKMVGAHTDSPCLRVKPEPLQNSNLMTRLGCEIYGGTLLNTWFDRGLNLAGRVTCRVIEDENERLQSVLINYNRPVALVPSLAIHLDREANKNRTVNPQLHIPPLFSIGDPEKSLPFKETLLARIKEEHPGTDIREVMDYELSFSDAEPCSYAGIDREIISAPRLDNLLSCHAALKGLDSAAPSSTAMVVFTDNEEVGSDTLAGARGSFLESVLLRMAGTPEQFARTAARSFMISCDNAHAVHPNLSEKHDSNHRPTLNTGPVLKINASQRYASDSESSALFRHVCKRAGLTVQNFVMRSDLPCGSTIGPAISSQTGIRTVDVGAATLAMHSIREMCGSNDPFMLFKALNKFFSLDEPPLLSLT